MATLIGHSHFNDGTAPIAATLAWPASYTPTAGDLAIISIAFRTADGNPVTVSSGWTDIDYYSVSAGATLLEPKRIVGRMLTGGDTLPTITLPGAIQSVQGTVTVWAGVNASPILDAPITYVQSTANPATPTGITTVTAGAPVMAVFSTDWNILSMNTANGYTQLELNTSGDGSQRTFYNGYKITGSAGAQTAVSLNHDGDNWIYVQIALRPAAAGGVNYNETGRTVSITATVAVTDTPGAVVTANYTELEWSLALQAPAVAADVYEFRVYAGSTPLDTYALTPQLTVSGAAGNNYNETNRPVLITAAITTTDQADFKEPGRAVAVVTATTATDQADFKELARPVPITATIALTEQNDYRELARVVSITATTAVVTERNGYRELALAIPVVATTAVIERNGYRELALAVPITATTAVIPGRNGYNDLALPVSIVADFTAFDSFGDLPDNYNETGRLIAITATVTLPTDQADYKEPTRTISITADVTRTDRVTRRDLALVVPITAQVAATDVRHHREPDRAVSITAATETTHLVHRREQTSVAIVATVTSTDRAGRKELALPVPITATVTTPTNQADYKDSLTVSVVATVAVEDSIVGAPNNYNETGRLVAISATVTLPTDQADYKQLALAIPITSVVSHTERQFRRETLVVSITSAVALTDRAKYRDPAKVINIVSGFTVIERTGAFDETGRQISVTSAISLVDRAAYRNPLVLDIASGVSVSSQAKYRQLLAVLIVATVTSSDLQRFASGVVLNTALALYLGNKPVQRVYLGTTQVWP